MQYSLDVSVQSKLFQCEAAYPCGAVASEVPSQTFKFYLTNDDQKAAQPEALYVYVSAYVERFSPSGLIR